MTIYGFVTNGENMALSGAERQRRWLAKVMGMRRVADAQAEQLLGVAEALRAVAAIRDDASLAKAKRLAARALEAIERA